MEHVMDEGTRAKMRGLLPYSDKSVISIVPESYKALDVDEKYKPVFCMRGLTRAEHMDLVQATQRATEGNTSEVTAIQLSVLRMIVIGWKNLFDGATGEEIKFSKDDDGGACASVFFALHYSVHIDLIGKMFEISGLSQLDKLGLKS